MLVGGDLLAWLMLALGGVPVVGNVAVIVRPRNDRSRRVLERAPITTSVVMVWFCLVAAVWALASLYAG